MPTFLLGIQIAFSFAAYSVLAMSATPWLRTLPRVRMLQLLLWTHVPRSAPLGLLAPGQIVGVAPEVANSIAWGDFACAVLALMSIIALRSHGERAMGWVWLFVAVSTLDIVTALTLGLSSGVQEHALGVGWYVLTLYVPLVCISHGLIAAALLRPNSITQPETA